MHGSYTANMALYECDLLINIGARFDDRLTGNLAFFAKGATVAHIDIDPNRNWEKCANRDSYCCKC